jgi:hypothetical protein
MLAQLLDVGHQMVTGIGMQRPPGLTAAAAALVKQGKTATGQIK